MQATYLTDRGQVREHNEDSGGFFYNQSNQLLAVIADGMGGHKAGDVASQTAVNVLKDKWKQSERIVTPGQAEEWLEEVLSEANKSIYKQANKQESYAGMGTTIVLALIIDDFATIGHIGDSRCYISNEDGFKQITSDHSLVSELVRSGEITSEDAKHHPRKNIVLKALGTKEDVKPDIQTIGIEDRDKLLLCSDGLTDKIDNAELSDFLQSEIQMKETGEKLIDLANERGGEDNISLVLLQGQNKRELGDSSC